MAGSSSGDETAGSMMAPSPPRIGHKPPLPSIPLVSHIKRRAPSNKAESDAGRTTSRCSSSRSLVSSSQWSLDSEQLLEESYSEWLEEKKRKSRAQRKALRETNEKKEQECILKQNERKEKSKKVVAQWRSAKEQFIKEKKKQEKEKEEISLNESKELLEKQEESTAVAEKWRKEKTKLLREQQKKSKEREKDENEKKLEEEKLKMESAAMAFKSWSDKKDKVNKELHRAKIQGQKNQQEMEETLKHERQKQSQSVYQAWCAVKNEKLKKTKKLYTYNTNPRQPPKDNKWCPARALKHTYPTDPTIKSTRKPSPAKTTNESYQDDSFESESSRGSISSHAMEDKRKTGQLKTITVCCQSIDYWCTCNDDSNSTKSD